MQYMREIRIAVLILTAAAITYKGIQLHRCRQQNQVIIQHAAGAGSGPGPFGWK